MHSSRMRTGRSLTVCWSLLHEGGVWSRGVWSRGGGSGHGKGGVCSGGGVSAPGGGVCSQGGVCSRGCLLPGGGGIPACTEADTPPPLWTESQTPVKTLPWPNFVAAGNNNDVVCSFVAQYHTLLSQTILLLLCTIIICTG